jgi:PAS domain S-box-containing protein
MASLQAHLSAVMLVATVPLALVLAYHMFNGMQAEHARMNDELQHHASALAGSVERELQASVNALRLLADTTQVMQATGQPTPDAELAALAAAMRSALPARPQWHSLYLRYLGGPLIFDSASGAPMPAARAASAGTTPQVTTGQADGLSALEVPWRLADGQPCILGARLTSVRWQPLTESRRPAEGFATVLDRNGHVVAQGGASQLPLGPELLAGTALEIAGPAPAGNDTSAPESNAADLHRTVLSDGSAVYLAWRTVPTAGWRVAVGRPAAPLDTAQRQATIAGLATIAASLVVGLALATLVARRVTDPLRQLATRGPTQVPSPKVEEIAWLRDALSDAQHQEAEARIDLQRKAAEFETLFASTPIGLAFLREPQAPTLHNAAMNELAGPADAPPDGPLANTMRLAGRPLAPEERPLQQAAASGKPVGPLELELTSAGRAPRHVLVQAVPLLDADGRPQGALSTMVDISARKAAEQRVQETDSQLKQSQRLIELAHEAGEIGFFRIDLQSATWTPGQARLFGLDPSQAPGAMEDLLRRIHPDDRPAVEQQLRGMVAHRKERETLEFRVVLADGSERWLSNRVLMSFAEDGRPRDLTGATLDITEQKTAELERATLIEREQQARIDAESASRAKDEFLAMLGHELRNPLGAIASATEVLTRATPDSPLAGNARAIIIRQTRHLARLVDDLLDVGRVISGKVELSRHPLDLQALVRRVVENFELTGASCKHRVELALDEVWVVADATRMEQVLNNLLGNALKYSQEGTRIEIQLVALGGQAVLRVRDEGEGIAPELLPHVFDLFVQGERRLDRRSGGLGIGLTLVRQLVELHGGQVQAESTPLVGSCFTVRLPAAAPPTSAAQDKPDLHRRRRRVLVIEDNADALWAMQAMLEFDGHLVSTALDGRQGLSRLLEEQPEVAIIDIGLPGLTGFEVALRSRRAGFAGTLLALSGYGGERDLAEALRHGFDAHIAKPIDPERLRVLLAQA